MRGTAIGAGLVAATALAAFGASNPASAQSVDDILEAEQQRLQRARDVQDQIDDLAQETRSLFNERQRVLQDIEGVEVYNRMMQARVDDQNETLANLRSSIDRVTEVERRMLPLMQRMVAGLERFIENDVPFLLDERRARVERLRSMLTRADVSVAEQFRNVLEAWQIEMNDYGSVSEVYTDEITALDGTTREVQFLRVGRIALMYITPDGSLAAAWNKETESWEELPSDYVSAIQTGIDIIEGDITPRLFLIPVLPPEEG